MTRPTPKTVPWDRDYWANGEKGILSAQRCQDCDRLWYYPKPVCPTCMSENFIYEHLSGAGEIYTFSIVRRPENPSFVDEAPYAFIDVRLDEGIRASRNASCGRWHQVPAVLPQGSLTR